MGQILRPFFSVVQDSPSIKNKGKETNTSNGSVRFCSDSLQLL